MAKAKYITDGTEYPGVSAYQQPENPEYWYVHVNDKTIDLEVASIFDGVTTDLDRLLTVLKAIKKASK